MLESFNYLTILKRLLRETGSTPVVGSSKNSIVGETRRVRAHESFLLLPPDRFPALTFINSSKSRVCTISLRLFSNYAVDRPLIRAINFRFSFTVS